jgi:hypothetical protein
MPFSRVKSAAIQAGNGEQSECWILGPGYGLFDARCEGCSEVQRIILPLILVKRLRDVFDFKILVVRRSVPRC